MNSASSIQVNLDDLRKQMESSELKNQRLKEVFQRKIQEFRTVCYILTGYQMDITTENQYRLTSVYAEHMDDSLLFKKVELNLNLRVCLVLIARQKVLEMYRSPCLPLRGGTPHPGPSE
ncbi:Mitotic spindle assembly checkpoint protein MAD1 [Takifugu flavidus]|uniref:Mitotic spindle assembly checkpoint protein MAD1 n=1 Tax=Takifugu flavidus TaxID=433684 RepID=A0A5C6MV51_9TELE|nr:Mitotic spindle assembly checkpoint protein MAD1 [Takifugu flavidus]